MSSAKGTWADVASKTSFPKASSIKRATRQSKMAETSDPILYQPLIPALASLDIECSRCNHKSHPVFLDDLPDNEPRSVCPECTVCFPIPIGQVVSHTQKPASKTESVSSEVELYTSSRTPASTDGRPNTIFFEKDREEEVSYADLLKGSVPDDTPRHKLGMEPPIGTGRPGEASMGNALGVRLVPVTGSEAGRRELKDIPTPFKEYVRKLWRPIGYKPSPFYGFDQGLEPRREPSVPAKLDQKHEMRAPPHIPDRPVADSGAVVNSRRSESGKAPMTLPRREARLGSGSDGSDM